MSDTCAMLDTTPPSKAAVQAWNMRPRDKRLEIGPQFRFTHRTQLQRMHDDLSNQIHNEFVDYECVAPTLAEEVKNFVHSGKYQFVNEPQFQCSAHQSTSHRSKLSNTLLFKPRELLGTMHQKTHFKAGETVKTRLPAGSLKIRKDEYSNKFQEIARNVEYLKQSQRQQQEMIPQELLD